MNRRAFLKLLLYIGLFYFIPIKINGNDTINNNSNSCLPMDLPACLSSLPFKKNKCKRFVYIPIVEK